jgi:DNA repair exonuclease SbcCD ATPase subunit
MSDPSNARSESAAADTGGLMSSIAAVREILMMNTVAESEAVNELHKHKQKSYEEILMLKGEIEKQRSSVQDLQSTVEQGREEVKREKSVRQALETSHAALEEHKKELLVQLEIVKGSRVSLEGKISGFRDDLEKENNAFMQERAKWEELERELRSQNENALKNTGALEARLLASQRQTAEIESRLSSMRKEGESSATRREETIQGYVNSNEQLKKRIELGNVTSIESLQLGLNESEAARESTMERVRMSLVLLVVRNGTVHQCCPSCWPNVRFFSDPIFIPSDEKGSSRSPHTSARLVSGRHQKGKGGKRKDFHRIDFFESFARKGFQGSDRLARSRCKT